MQSPIGVTHGHLGRWGGPRGDALLHWPGTCHHCPHRCVQPGRERVRNPYPVSCLRVGPTPGKAGCHSSSLSLPYIPRCFSSYAPPPGSLSQSGGGPPRAQSHRSTHLGCKCWARPAARHQGSGVFPPELCLGSSTCRGGCRAVGSWLVQHKKIDAISVGCEMNTAQ